MNDQKRKNPPCRAGSEYAELIGRLHGHCSARQHPRKGTAAMHEADTKAGGSGFMDTTQNKVATVWRWAREAAQ